MMAGNGGSILFSPVTETKKKWLPGLHKLMLGLCLFIVSWGFHGNTINIAQTGWFAGDAKSLGGTAKNDKIVSTAATPSQLDDNGPVNAEASNSSANIAEEYEPLNECGNSQRWLNEKRHGNLRHDPLFTGDLAKNMVLDLDKLLVSEQRHTILGQSICHERGRFRNDTAAGLSLDDRTVRLWAVRLIYYAMHYHQHRLAVPEATQRHRRTQGSSCSQETLQQQHNVGVFDYECPNAKYIIVGVSGNGLGANVRGLMIPAFLMGLTFDRIVLFVNNAADEAKHSTKPWEHASCPQRKDFQCFFMPPSPCTLTLNEIANAHVIDVKGANNVMKEYSQRTDVHQHKVWKFYSNVVPVKLIGLPVKTKLHEYAQILVEAVPDTPENANFAALLKQALEAITTEEQERRWNKIFHALSIYSIRPNPSSAAKLDKTMDEIIPNHLDPEITIGLPVRASDKCLQESTCLSFSDHIVATTELWEMHLNETSGSHRHPTVLFTTEAKDMMQEQQNWVKENEQAKLPFHFDFVTNAKDLLPDSGWAKDSNAKGIDADENMLSSMSSFKFQLLPRVSVGNCCSNFHDLLNAFLLGGCGAASDNTFACLQDFENPLLGPCCMWNKQCKPHQNAIRAELQTSATALAAFNAAYKHSVYDPISDQMRLRSIYTPTDANKSNL